MLYDQNYLNKIASEDTCHFLQEVTNWCNHRPLLYLALRLSEAGDILELGTGDGSTHHLHAYGLETRRAVISYDNNPDWIAKYAEKYRSAIPPIHEFFCSSDPEFLDDIVQTFTEEHGATVCLVDHAPGERRHVDLEAIADRVPYVVLHDSELAAQAGYMLEKIWPLYKYRLNLNSNGACACLLSNIFDVTVFDNMKLGDFLLETSIA